MPIGSMEDLFEAGVPGEFGVLDAARQPLGPSPPIRRPGSFSVDAAPLSDHTESLQFGFQALRRFPATTRVNPA